MHILGPIWDRGNVCACYTVFFTEVDYLRFASIRVLGAARPITIFVYLWYFRKCPAKVCFDFVDIYVTKLCGKVWNFAFRDGAVEESHFTQFALYYTCMWCFTDNSTNELADTSTRGPAIWFVSELSCQRIDCQRVGLSARCLLSHVIPCWKQLSKCCIFIQFATLYSNRLRNYWHCIQFFTFKH